MVEQHSIRSVVDLGCGPGHYQSELAKHTSPCHGFDGNPHTPWNTNGRCGMLDLSVPVKLACPYDLVLSLEVGEHIPAPFEAVYLDNLTRHALRYVVLSWALPGQGGYGHVNERPNTYIQDRMHDRGFAMRPDLSAPLRSSVHWWWFRETVMVFERIAEPPRT